MHPPIHHVPTLEGHRRSLPGLGRLAWAPAAYAALAYVTVCFVIYAFEEREVFALVGEPNRALHGNLTWFLGVGLAGGALAFVATRLIALGFRREWKHVAGMFLLVVFHALLGLGSSLLFRHSHFLLYIWPGVLSAAILWTASIDSAYPVEDRWKWEAASFAVLFVGFVALVPYMWDFMNRVYEPGLFWRKNVVIILQGVGLILYVYVTIRRLSPRSEPGGLMSFFRMLSALVQVVFQGYQQGRSASEVSGAIEETVRNLLADMRGRTKKTILYSGIERSAAMIERLGDQDAYSLFQESWTLSCRELKTFGGSPPKDLGDGLLTTFDSARDAIRAAVAIQRAHAAFNDGQPPDRRVRLRIGLNTGHIFLHQRWDPRGRESHLAQRVSSAAEPGQVLISKNTFDEAQGADPALRATPLRAATLKGIREPVEIYRVAVEAG